MQFETFRNKLLPGQKEQWKIKIKDKKGDKMMAEMMATLYDASLDVFKPNIGNFNIYNNYYSQLYWDNSLAFGEHYTNMYDDYWNPYVYYPATIIRPIKLVWLLLLLLWLLPSIRRRSIGSGRTSSYKRKCYSCCNASDFTNRLQQALDMSDHIAR